VCEAAKVLSRTVEPVRRRRRSSTDTNHLNLPGENNILKLYYKFPIFGNVPLHFVTAAKQEQCNGRGFTKKTVQCKQIAYKPQTVCIPLSNKD
jgi:hypothetical protein